MTDNSSINTYKPKLCNILEALLFVCGDPIGIDELANGLNVTELEISSALEELRKSYDRDERGIALRYINGKPQLCTHNNYSEYIEMFLQPHTSITFSQTVIETLSIVAYKQPITRPEIEAIRGVRCEYAIQQLLSLGLIESIGKKQTIGRPSIYATTDKFLHTFGISSVEELPNKEDLRNIDLQSSGE